MLPPPEMTGAMRVGSPMGPQSTLTSLAPKLSPPRKGLHLIQGILPLSEFVVKTLCSILHTFFPNA